MRHVPPPGRNERGPSEAASNPYASRIESVGVKLPEQRVHSRQVMDASRHGTHIDLERISGVRERRVCAEGEDSYTLAVDAAWNCLTRSRHQPGDIEMIIHCGITKFCDGLSYRFEPALSLSIKAAIGAEGAVDFDVSNACAGMLTGVAILDSFVRNGTIRCGMVVSGEYVTSISDNAARRIRRAGDPQLASLTVGDAGAAVIVDRGQPDEPGIRAWEFATHPEFSDLCTGGPSVDGIGAQMETNAPQIHKQAIAHCAAPVRSALAACGLALDDIDYLIPHQTSARAIREGARHLEREVGSMARVVVANLEQYGNTASTTHFLALDGLIQAGSLRAADRIMLLAFASGMVIGSLVFTVGELGAGHGRSH